MTDLLRASVFALFGYLSGSLLFAYYFGKLFYHRDIIALSDDHNPGVVNAFKYGGFLAGIFGLIFDLGKGFLPVFWYMHSSLDPEKLSHFLPVILCMPVLGHAYSVFHKLHGGKCITVTFGVLLGLFPQVRPVTALILSFLFFSLVVIITPNFYRTLFTYLVTNVCMLILVRNFAVRMGFLLITMIVFGKFRNSTEKIDQLKVVYVWKS